jgi:hypothetical protein
MSMDEMRIIIKDNCQIPCTVCKGECLNKGWHLTNGNFCSIECMCRYIECINLILDEFEQKIKIIENRIELQEKLIKKKGVDKYGRRRKKFEPS